MSLVLSDRWVSSEGNLAISLVSRLSESGPVNRKQSPRNPHFWKTQQVIQCTVGFGNDFVIVRKQKRLGRKESGDLNWKGWLRELSLSPNPIQKVMPFKIFNCKERNPTGTPTPFPRKHPRTISRAWFIWCAVREVKNSGGAAGNPAERKISNCKCKTPTLWQRLCWWHWKPKTEAEMTWCWNIQEVKRQGASQDTSPLPHYYSGNNNTYLKELSWGLKIRPLSCPASSRAALGASLGLVPGSSLPPSKFFLRWFSCIQEIPVVTVDMIWGLS